MPRDPVRAQTWRHLQRSRLTRRVRASAPQSKHARTRLHPALKMQTGCAKTGARAAAPSGTRARAPRGARARARRGAARLLGGHAAAEDRGRGQVAPVPRVGRAHHVLGVPHLLRQLGHRERAVLLAAAARQRREADYEEVEPREGDQVDRQLAQVRVQLPCARARGSRIGSIASLRRWPRSAGLRARSAVERAARARAWRVCHAWASARRRGLAGMSICLSARSGGPAGVAQGVYACSSMSAGRADWNAHMLFVVKQASHDLMTCRGTALRLGTQGSDIHNPCSSGAAPAGGRAARPHPGSAGSR